jgi:hypothetical protein
MENGSISFTSQLVAPTLHKFGTHPWAWASLSDLTRVLGLPAEEIWNKYKEDARQSVLEETWDGAPWKFLSTNQEFSARITKSIFRTETIDRRFDNAHPTVVVDVWDMKTGQCVEVPHDELAGVFLPAGWSRVKTKESDRLDQSVRTLLTAAGDTGPIKEALNALGTYGNLKFALDQLQAGPNSLRINIAEDMSKSIVTVTFTTVPSGTCNVTVTIRLLLGRLSVLTVSRWKSGD